MPTTTQQKILNFLGFSAGVIALTLGGLATVPIFVILLSVALIARLIALPFIFFSRPTVIVNSASSPVVVNSHTPSVTIPRSVAPVIIPRSVAANVHIHHDTLRSSRPSVHEHSLFSEPGTKTHHHAHTSAARTHYTTHTPASTAHRHGR